MNGIGVQISSWKSLISDTGCAEFAKRFLVDNLRVDLSPISLRCLFHYSHPFGLYGIREKSSVKRFSTLCRCEGYNTLSRLAASPSVANQRVGGEKAMWDRPLLPLELWLGGGAPFNPYLRAQLVSYLQKKWNPRELKDVPDLLWEEEDLERERTLIFNWMKRWLAYYQWYISVALDPWVSLSTLLNDAPVRNSHWNRAGAERWKSSTFRWSLEDLWYG